MLQSRALMRGPRRIYTTMEDIAMRTGQFATYIVIPLLFAASVVTAATYTWNVDADGTWTDMTNWDPATNYPRVNTDVAIFGDAITQPRQIGVSANLIVQQLVFDSVQSYAIVTSGNYHIQVEGAGPLNCISNAQGHHVAAVRRIYIPQNAECNVYVESDTSFTIVGDFEAPASSGRGLYRKFGGGEFRVTGMTYNSNWRNPEVVAGTLALEGGLQYRKGWGESQNNKTLRVHPGATLRIGGTVGTGLGSTNSPSLNLDGILDVFGTLNWNDGDLDLRDAQEIRFELGAQSDRIVYTPETASTPTIFGRTSGTTLLRFALGGGFTTGVYDLIDWSGSANITVDNLDLSDFQIDIPPTPFTTTLSFDNGVTTADAGTTKLQLNVIPEPAAMTLLLGGFLAPAIRRRLYR